MGVELKELKKFFDIFGKLYILTFSEMINLNEHIESDLNSFKLLEELNKISF